MIRTNHFSFHRRVSLCSPTGGRRRAVPGVTITVHLRRRVHFLTVALNGWHHISLPHSPPASLRVISS